MERFLPYLLVGVGSFIGGNARFVLARWVGGFVEGRFPAGTFLINVSGSFVLGFLRSKRSRSYGVISHLTMASGPCEWPPFSQVAPTIPSRRMLLALWIASCVDTQPEFTIRCVGRSKGAIKAMRCEGSAGA